MKFKLPNFAARMSDFKRRVLKEAAATLYEEAERVMEESKERYCPVDTGALRSTGRVLGPFTWPNRVRVVMRYGGSKAPYARIVHEWIDRPGPVNWSVPGTGPKYLEKPFLAARGQIHKAVSRAVRRAKMGV